MIGFFVFTAFEIIRNWYVISRLKESPNHTYNVIFRAFFFSLISLVYFDADLIPMAKYVFACHLSFWFLFDLGLNLMRGKVWNYQGQTAWLDKITYEYSDFFWCIKFVLCVIGLDIIRLL